MDFAVRSSIWSGHRIKDSQFQPFSPPLPEEHRQTCDNGIISYRITRVIKEIIPLISIFITRDENRYSWNNFLNNPRRYDIILHN